MGRPDRRPRRWPDRGARPLRAPAVLNSDAMSCRSNRNGTRAHPGGGRSLDRDFHWPCISLPEREGGGGGGVTLEAFAPRILQEAGGPLNTEPLTVRRTAPFDCTKLRSGRASSGPAGDSRSASPQPCCASSPMPAAAIHPWITHTCVCRARACTHIHAQSVQTHPHFRVCLSIRLDFAIVCAKSPST